MTKQTLPQILNDQLSHDYRDENKIPYHHEKYRTDIELAIKRFENKDVFSIDDIIMDEYRLNNNILPRKEVKGMIFNYYTLRKICIRHESEATDNHKLFMERVLFDLCKFKFDKAPPKEQTINGYTSRIIIDDPLCDDDTQDKKFHYSGLGLSREGDDSVKPLIIMGKMYEGKEK